MKRIFLTTAALALLGTGATAEIDRMLIRSNVPATEADGSTVYAAGFLFAGDYYIGADAAEGRTFDATVVPASVDVYDLDEVTDWLASQGMTNTRPLLRYTEGCAADPGLTAGAATCTTKDGDPGTKTSRLTGADGW